MCDCDYDASFRPWNARGDTMSSGPQFPVLERYEKAKEESGGYDDEAFLGALKERFTELGTWLLLASEREISIDVKVVPHSHEFQFKAYRTQSLYNWEEYRERDRERMRKAKEGSE